MTAFTEDLYGRTLRSEKGIIGSLRDFRISTRDWQVVHVVWKRSGWPGGGKGRISVEGLEEFSPCNDAIDIRLRGHCTGFHVTGFSYEQDIWATMGFQAPGLILNRTQGLRDCDEGQVAARGFKGCHVVASDGTAGMLRGFMIDTSEWRISGIVVRTGPWYSGEQIVVAPEALESVEHYGPGMEVGFSRKSLLRNWKRAQQKARSGNATT